ncbi:DNA-binding helix-turn-helix protein [Eubacterium brachy ATCC 33089]|nr:DNA-binding helix-turn-helix protein [Eubacterium brachy ATCC 33089]
MLDLYKNIRRIRIEKGLSQEYLALKTGYTDRSSIAKIESGKIDLPISKVEIFAQALGVGVDELTESTFNSSDDDNEQYYHDKEVARIAEELKDNPGKRVLFDAMRDISEEDMLLLKKLIDKMTKQD